MRKRTAVILTVALCGLTAGLIWTPVAKANVYAAHLAGPATWDTGVQGDVMLEYRLNEPATSVTIEVFRTSAPATVVKTIVGTTTYGLNSVAWDGSKDGGGNAASASDYAFRVIASDSTGHATWANITPLDGGNEIGSAQYYAPVGLTINKDQNNAQFGTIFVVSGSSTAISTNAGATAVGDGLFMLHNDMTFTGTEAFDSFIGLVTAGAASTISPWRGQISPDDSDAITVSSFTDAFEDVWLVQPSTGTVTVLLDKLTTGPAPAPGPQNHGNTVAAVLKGTGANRALYTIDEDFDVPPTWVIPPQLDILRYNIGTTTTDYTGAPLEVANGGESGLGADGPLYSSRDIMFGASGDIYVASRRANAGATNLAVSRFTLDGSGVINGAVWSKNNDELTSDPLIASSWLYTNAVDVDEARNRVAIGRDIGTGRAAILQASDGTVVGHIPNTGGGTFRDLSWDAAGNLYTSNQTDEHVRMWSPPDGSNAFTTTYYATMDVTISGAVPTPPSIADANSVKAHGGAGSFSVDLWNAGANTGTVENRQGGPTSVVVQFDKNIQQVTGTNADVLMVNGTVSALAVAGDTLTVTTSGAVNGVVSTMTFPGIATAGSPLLVNTQTLCIRPLVGDADNGGAVNIFDLIQIRNNLNQAVAAGNFRSDVTAEGNINIFDLIATRNALNVTVPACP